jgi:hypothetical protein
VTDFRDLWDDEDDLTVVDAHIARELAARGIDITYDELSYLPIPYRLPFGDGGER